MTTVQVRGEDYDFDAMPFVGDLRLLQKEFGFGWATVTERLAKVPAGTKFSEIFSDEHTGPALVAQVWMVMLRGGNRTVTRADVEQIPLDEIRFYTNEPTAPAEDEADPTPAQTGSALGDDEAPAAKPTTRSTKTSKPRSPRASR